MTPAQPLLNFTWSECHLINHEAHASSLSMVLGQTSGTGHQMHMVLVRNVIWSRSAAASLFIAGHLSLRLEWLHTHDLAVLWRCRRSRGSLDRKPAAYLRVC